MQHRQVPLVGKGHILHGDFALHVFQGHRVRRVLDRRLGAHDLHKPVQSRKAVGQQLGEAGELAQGGDKGGDVQAEGHQVPVVQLVFHNHIAADGNDHHVHAGEEEFHGAVEHTHGPVEFPLGGFELVVGRAKPGIFQCLVAEGLGGADAGEAGLDLRINVAHLLFDLHRGPAHSAPHGEHHNEENGDQRRHHQGQLPADGGHDDQRADDGDHRGQQILRAVVGQLRQLEQVGGQAAHQLPRAVGIVKIKAHFLQMPEQISADIRLYPNAEGVAVIADDVVEEGPQQVKHHHAGHNGKENGVFFVGQQIVEGLPGDQGEGKINGGDAHGAAKVHREKPLVGRKISQENPQGGFFPILLCCHFRYLQSRPLYRKKAKMQRKSAGNDCVFRSFLIYWRYGGIRFGNWNQAGRITPTLVGEATSLPPGCGL